MCWTSSGGVRSSPSWANDLYRSSGAKIGGGGKHEERRAEGMAIGYTASNEYTAGFSMNWRFYEKTAHLSKNQGCREPRFEVCQLVNAGRERFWVFLKLEERRRFVKSVFPVFAARTSVRVALYPVFPGFSVFQHELQRDSK